MILILFEVILYFYY